MPADPGLSKEYRTAIVQLDQRRHQDEQWRERRQAKAGPDDVKSPLDLAHARWRATTSPTASMTSATS